MTVYRDFDQETLNREYAIRDSVPLAEFEATIARYGTESAKARESLDCLVDVSFGDSADEIMDIFPAKGGAPLFVFIHGGYWRMLSHTESSFMAPNLVSRGAAVATVNYTLAPAVTLDEIVRQCRAAIAFLHANAATYGADPDRIHVCGSSAGGHLVGMLAAGGWHEKFGVPKDVIKSVCALSGLHDLEPVRLSNVNEWMNLDEIASRRNSPIHHLPEHGCPLIVSHGGSETAEFKRQTTDYAAAWRAKGFPCEHVDGTPYSHFDIVFDLNDPNGAIARAVLDQMGL